jgi:aspartyl-tRNA(Asn)/glutamyl-tRNA(Gln) amidotransferase subunit C
MKKIDTNFVKNISNLSRLGLTDNEITLLINDLEKMLSYVSSLNNIDTEKSETFSHVLDVANIWREDATSSFSSPEKIIENAPEHYGNYIKVPKII